MKISEIINEQVNAKVSELSDWKEVRYEGGRLYYETTRILNEINDYDIENQILYLESLLKKSFLIRDNWPHEAPDITSDFKNWLIKHVSKLKIKHFQSSQHNSDHNLPLSNEQNSNQKFNDLKNSKSFINNNRIIELQKVDVEKFDLTRLIKMLEELNDNYSTGNYLSVVMISRSIINHIPPIFGHMTFDQVCGQYGAKSFKKNMSHLNKSMKSIAEMYLHEKIRKSESLPNENQVDFSRELDVLLAEITRALK